MTKKFDDQGGVATMDPSAAMRFVTSKFMTARASRTARARRHAKAESKRKKTGARHRVEYFHQVEDGYSHLAAQLLRPLLDHYDVELVCHLCTVKRDRNLPEPEMLLPLSRLDSYKVAPHYGLNFPGGTENPKPEHVEIAQRILAAVSQAKFPEAAVAVGEAVFAGDAASLGALAELYGQIDGVGAAQKVEAGTERRGELGHYSGAMFYYGGEWYWGADRFYHLENRLLGLGTRKDPSQELLCPRPAIEMGPRVDDGSLTFEIYASLRSPYTSIIFDKAVELARKTGVRMVMRPVLPMVMRGVPATRQKGFYIFTDAAREAEVLGLEWGPFYDPIGEPVRRAYSLYSFACRQGKGTELLSEFLRAAFFEGVNTGNDRGLRRVVEGAGLSWQEAKPLVGKPGWEGELEANRLEMYAFGSWGVPSFRLLDAAGHEVLGLWGQDRLWLFSREIQRLLGQAKGAR